MTTPIPAFKVKHNGRQANPKTEEELVELYKEDKVNAIQFACSQAAVTDDFEKWGKKWKKEANEFLSDVLTPGDKEFTYGWKLSNVPKRKVIDYDAMTPATRKQYDKLVKEIEQEEAKFEEQIEPLRITLRGIEETYTVEEENPDAKPRLIREK